MEYTPKINPAAVLAGYVGANPNTVAVMDGYLNNAARQQPQQQQQQQPDGHNKTV